MPPSENAPSPDVAPGAQSEASAAARPPEAAPPREDRLFLPDDRKLRPGLVSAFERILARAARQVDRVGDEPDVAVHEFRKSVRRARALLALLRPSLRKGAHRNLAAGLRSAHRATSGMRDSDVLLGTLDRLSKAAEDRDGAATAVEYWRAQFAQRSGDAQAPGEAGRVLREAAATLPDLSERFARALRKKTRWRDIERGLRRTLRRAQKARLEAAGPGRDEALHDWRKRVKELNYQLEILTRGSTVGPVATRRAFADLAEELGKITDRLVLREAIAASPTASAAPAGAGLLAEVATGDIERRRAKVLDDSRALMVTSPRQFAEELVAEARSARRALRTRPKDGL